jgi:hypothetical protein
MEERAVPLDTYALLKDFAGPTATLVAATTAAIITFVLNRSQTRIAQSQRGITLDRLKFDLFQHRYSIYDAAKKLLEEIAFTAAVNRYDPTKIRSLYVTLCIIGIANDDFSGLCSSPCGPPNGLKHNPLSD